MVADKMLVEGASLAGLSTMGSFTLTSYVSILERSR
jgi:hypothetical protein